MSISCRVVARVKRERPLEAERVRAPQNRGSRSVYFQGNVTDAFRRSEAELACSEISIVTTRTSVFRERRAHTDRDGRGVGCGGLGVRWSQKRALPYTTNEAYPRRDRNRVTLRGAHPRTTARWRPKSELPPPAKSAQVFTLQNLITRLAASTATLFTVACPPRPLPLACVRCLAEVEVIRSLLGSVFHVHHRVSRLGAPCARCAPGASMPLDRACVLILGLG